VLAPTADAKFQYRLASSLLENPTAILTSALRNAAKAAHFSRIAETLDVEHKVNLNDLLESPKVLETLKNELSKELKGEAKSAKQKKADEDEKKEEPAAEEAPAEEGEEAPAEGEEGAEGEVSPEEEELTIDEKVEQLETRVDVVEQEVQQLEGDTIPEAENEEINLEDMFGGEEGDMQLDEKMGALANEGDEVTASGEDDFFGPSNLQAGLEGMDEVDITEAGDFFEVTASDEPDQLGALMGGRPRSAKALRAEKESIVDPGEIADHFESELSGDDRDNETDHDGDLFAEVIESVSAPEFQQDHNVEAEFDLPKSAVQVKDNRNAAAKNKAAAGTVKTVQRGAAGMQKKSTVVKTVGNPVTSPKGSVDERKRIASLVFKDEDEY